MNLWEKKDRCQIWQHVHQILFKQTKSIVEKNLVGSSTTGKIRVATGTNGQILVVASGC